MRCCFAIALSLWAGLPAAETAQHSNTFVWTSDHPDFGGISGFDYLDNGERFFAVTDRGRFIEGWVERQDGRIVGVQAAEPAPMIVRDNQEIKQKGPDAEGVSVGPKGEVFVSFEGTHTVRVKRDAPRFATLPMHNVFAHLLRNGSLETLASGPDGALYTIPERSGQISADFEVFRFHGGTWSAFGTITRKEGFLPVGADMGPDGRFYLLERAFNGFGFRTRIRRYEIGPQNLQNERILLTTPTRRHGNLEAIAIWGTATTLRATLLSDDNFAPMQRTEIVEYHLPN